MSRTTWNCARKMGQLAEALEKKLISSWWVILFTVLCFVFYEQQMMARMDEFSNLRTTLQNLQNEKGTALLQQEHLLRQISSQDDPEWVALVLMNTLGLVPRGQTKVYFTETGL